VSLRWQENIAVSKDFNLKEAWNRNQKEITELRITRMAKASGKEFWIRENVLKPIWREFVAKKL
jgi:hypothetical protein